jgi:hypothetical protein
VDRGLVALCRAADGLLRAPADRSEQSADVRRVVPHAEDALEHGRDAPGRPGLTLEAERLGAQRQGGGEVREPLGRRLWSRAAGDPPPQGRHSLLPPPLAPLADRALGHAERGCDRPLRPAPLLELSCSQPSTLPPISRSRHTTSRHASPHPQAPSQLYHAAQRSITRRRCGRLDTVCYPPLRETGGIRVFAVLDDSSFRAAMSPTPVCSGSASSSPRCSPVTRAGGAGAPSGSAYWHCRSC